MKRLLLTGILGFGLIAGTAVPAFAGEEPPEPPKNEHCNSGRGNFSEVAGNLIIPGEGTGPGEFETEDCDPGNSGDVNRGGD